jgi:hypothetical protein
MALSVFTTENVKGAMKSMFVLIERSRYLQKKTKRLLTLRTCEIRCLLISKGKFHVIQPYLIMIRFQKQNLNVKSHTGVPPTLPSQPSGKSKSTSNGSSKGSTNPRYTSEYSLSLFFSISLSKLNFSFTILFSNSGYDNIWEETCLKNEACQNDRRYNSIVYFNWWDLWTCLYMWMSRLLYL